MNAIAYVFPAGGSTRCSAAGGFSAKRFEFIQNSAAAVDEDAIDA